MAQYKKRIEQVLELTEMREQADFRFMAYSAGQKQRLAIARAMLSEPEILLLDEATTSLDPITTRRLLNFTKETLAQKKQKTIIWCTHNLHEADEICDSLTILHRGKVLHSGPLQPIKTLLNHKMHYSLVVDNLHRELERQDDFRLIDKKNAKQLTCHMTLRQEEVPLLLRTLCNDGVKIFECAQIEQPLETAFNELVARHTPA